MSRKEVSERKKSREKDTFSILAPRFFAFIFFFPLYTRYGCGEFLMLVLYIAWHICRPWGYIGASNLFISPNTPTNHIPSIRYYSPCHSALVLRSRERAVRSTETIISYMQLFFLETMVEFFLSYHIK